jgi:lipopolysaccharide transport system ATP-binding protein
VGCTSAWRSPSPLTSETEILLMDEVLAVGDSAFQKKCLGKMGDVATHGRTVLFVSHNLVAVQNLCSRALWLKDGALAQQGPTAEIVRSYLSGAGQSQSERAWPERGTEPGNDVVRIRRLAVRPAEPTDDLITMATPVTIEAEYWNQIEGAQLHLCWHFLTDHQVVAFSSASIDNGQVPALGPLPEGLVRTVCRVPAHLLNEGTYRLTLLILRNGSKIAYRMDEALTFDVGDVEVRSGAWYGKEPGVVRPQLHWQTQFLGNPAP